MRKTTPFTTVLIANRGEIAMRVIKTARRLGYRTIAVFSEADRNAAHVAAADQAVCIGAAQPAQSYLNIEAIIAAARATGADAIHPGYGFLAENAGFAAACHEAGLIFIGPSPEAILAMGDKAGAKRLMIDAGVPCVPGYQGEDQSAERLAQEAANIGYPLMIKATAGGGGRGMRLVSAPDDFTTLLRSAQSEAQNAFGDATVILERAIIEPRHIEIQVFADRYGNVVHMGERDCSVQRRHQKLIEEGPSPAVDTALRQRMGATAVAAAKAIGYEGAGTLEFLLDRDGEFYFMEMNTRLQVEHPVTEAITGLDLVEWQLRVAAGEALLLAQEEIRFSGHAIEVRLCAEDVRGGFIPQSGTMWDWRPAHGIRTDHALYPGAEIPPFYDSMVAKLIAYGATRDEARRKLVLALGDMVALGVLTNQEFLGRCLSHPVFAAGGATTAFISQNETALLDNDQVDRQRGIAVAAWLACQTEARAMHDSTTSLASRLPMDLSLDFDGEASTIQIAQLDENSFALEIDGQKSLLVAIEGTDGKARFILDGIMESAAFLDKGATLLLHYRNCVYPVRNLTREPASRADPIAGDGRVRAAMNGRVVAIDVEAGAEVSIGQPLLTLEAMKMEHVHKATAAGRITTIDFGLGDQVAAGQILIDIEVATATAPDK